MKLEPATFPKLLKAMELIDFDNGRPHCARIAGEVWNAPTEHGVGVKDTHWHAYNFVEAESALATLTDEDFETFCIGEESEMQTIMNSRLWLGTAHVILELYFDDELSPFPGGEQ